jgi:hypothetical protein
MTSTKITRTNQRTFELDNLNVQNLRLAPHKTEPKPPFYLEDEAMVGVDGFTNSQREQVVDRIINRVKKL